MFWTTATGRLEQAAALDPAADAAVRVVDAVLPKGPVKDALHGTWLGHAVHPLLVALPIGMWSGASLLDLTGGDRSAARRLVGAGVLTVLPTAAAGWADWSELGASKRPKRVGLVHAAANVVTTAVYAASYLARRRGDQARGRDLALLGTVGLAVGGYLGGHLAYSEAVGVNRNADSGPTPKDWTDACAADEVQEGALHRVEVDGKALVLTRRAGALHGLEATCSHFGAPLDEGEIDTFGSDGACVVCPWHGSRFRLSDGGVARGPATSPQRAFDVREQGGRLQVRVRV
jgi:nitrite reductase/ring-hydroxylating ferredoxin subunit/uncharacterized membrane protein